MTETSKNLPDGLTLVDIFNSAVSIVRNLPKDGPVKPSNDTKLKFYAYFKQATEGPNKTPKPTFITGPTNWYKWDAWNKLGDMSKEDAMLGYVEELKKSMDEVAQDTDPEGSEILHEEEAKKFYQYCKWKDVSDNIHK